MVIQLFYINHQIRNYIVYHEKVGLFGGSFDPIHKAHVTIAKLALEQLQLDEIQFIPTKNNPWKDQNCATRQERLDMMVLAIQDETEMTINNIEIDSKSDKKILQLIL